MSRDEKINEVVRKLQEKGHRITSQRRLLIGVILEHEHSSCKEIYFAAKKADNRVGIATVYRTVQMLEDMDIVRKEMVVHV